ncbi:MAG: alpha/beta hydrolase [Candidatus Latescibacterota bacterium]|nr:MAG: alpha/beta hydrolase [Candidatus Latescibacterota bacterium]
MKQQTDWELGMIQSTRNLAALVFLVLTSGACSTPSTNVVTSSDGVRIAYEVHGQGEPVLVFIHGWCCDRSHWNEQVPYFSREHAVVTIDLAGHGESGRNRAEWTMGAFGADVAAVIDTLDLRRVILIGSSMGGSVMLEAALQMPKRVIGLVSVDALANPDTTFSIEENLSLLQTDFEATMEKVARSLLNPAADSALVQRVAASLAACPPEVALPTTVTSFEYYNQGQCKRALRRITVPIRGIHSQFPLNKNAFRPYTQSIEAVTLADAGHLSMLEKPDEFNRILAKYVDEIGNMPAFR